MGSLSSNLANRILTTIVLVIIVWQILADTSEDVGDAADNLSTKGATTYPLMSFFKKKGVLLLAFIAGIVLLLVGSFMGKSK